MAAWWRSATGAPAFAPRGGSAAWPPAAIRREGKTPPDAINTHTSARCRMVATFRRRRRFFANLVGPPGPTSGFGWVLTHNFSYGVDWSRTSLYHHWNHDVQPLGNPRAPVRPAGEPACAAARHRLPPAPVQSGRGRPRLGQTR